MFELLLTTAVIGQTPIACREDLEAIADAPDEHYVLTADIDLSDAPWEPIDYFGGVLDGAGHSIKGLDVIGVDDVAMIRQLDGIVWDLALSGRADGLSRVSLLAAVQSPSGYIGRVHVHAEGPNAWYYLGGLAGQSAGVIEDCLVTGIAGVPDDLSYSHIGLAVGRMLPGARLRRTFIYGGVTVYHGNVAAVVVGTAAGNTIIEDVGVVGFLSDHHGAPGAIGGLILGSGGAELRRCYAVGVVQNFLTRGSLAGHRGAGEIVDCHYEALISGLGGCGNDELCGTPHALIEMTLSKTYEPSWDWGSTWAIEQEGQDTPHLIYWGPMP